MADVDVTPEQTLRGTTGLEPTFTSLSTSDTYKVLNEDGTTLLYFKNADAAARTVTIVSAQAGADGLALDDPALVIAAGDDIVWGPVPRVPYNDPSDNKFDLTVSGANVSMAAIKTGS